MDAIYVINALKSNLKLTKVSNKIKSGDFHDTWKCEHIISIGLY